MKDYKDFEKKYIGTSDIAALVLIGISKEGGVNPQMLHFGKDGSYSAYIVEGDDDVEIGEHYHKVAEFKNWLSIYDDNDLTMKLYADKIIIYRAREMGCIIQVIGEE